MANPPPGLFQHRIAADMADRVVDLLEAVEIDEQERKAARLAQGAADLLAQARLQVAPVGQRRDFVVVRLQVQLLIARGGGQRHAQAIGDVAGHLAGRCGNRLRSVASKHQDRRQAGIEKDRHQQRVLRTTRGQRCQKSMAFEAVDAAAFRLARQQLQQRRRHCGAFDRIRAGRSRRREIGARRAPRGLVKQGHRHQAVAEQRRRRPQHQVDNALEARA